ncbi:MAG: hypothetical protein DRJ50_10045, partial [Actinobacteria bacterium]
MPTEQSVILPTRLTGKVNVATPTSRYGKGDNIPSDVQNLYNTDINALRFAADPVAAVRMLAKKEGTVGSAVFSFVEVANSGYSVKAYSTGTSQYNQQGTTLAQDQMARMDTLYDYTQGYADRRTVSAVVTSLLKEVTIGSLAALELVLDKARMPERLIPVPYEGISWKADGKGGKYPVQPGTYTGGDEVELNIATFWTAVMHEDLTKVYSTPMLEPAIDRSFQFLDFLQDMWRVVRSSGHVRLVLTL